METDNKAPEQSKQPLSEFQQAVLVVLKGAGMNDMKKMETAAELIEQSFLSSKNHIILSRKDNYVLIKMYEDFQVSGVSFPDFPVPLSYTLGAIIDGTDLIKSIWRQANHKYMQDQEQKKPDIIVPTGPKIH